MAPCIWQNKDGTEDVRRVQQDLALAHKFIVGSLEGEDMFRRTDDPDRVSTRQSADPSSLAARYARTDMRKYSFGVESQTPGTDWNRKSGTAGPPNSSKHN